jgi:hypothetical protein
MAQRETPCPQGTGGCGGGEEGEGNARRGDYSKVDPVVAMPPTEDALDDWRWYERTNPAINFSTSIPDVKVLSIRSATDPVRDPPVP